MQQRPFDAVGIPLACRDVRERADVSLQTAEQQLQGQTVAAVVHVAGDEQRETVQRVEPRLELPVGDLGRAGAGVLAAGELLLRHRPLAVA